MERQSMGLQSGKGGRKPGKNTCAACIHYIPHFVKVEHDYKISAFGHCTYPQIKVRKSDSRACAYFDVEE